MTKQSYLFPLIPYSKNNEWYLQRKSNQYNNESYFYKIEPFITKDNHLTYTLINPFNLYYCLTDRDIEMLYNDIVLFNQGEAQAHIKKTNFDIINHSSPSVIDPRVIEFLLSWDGMEFSKGITGLKEIIDAEKEFLLKHGTTTLHLIN